MRSRLVPGEQVIVASRPQARPLFFSALLAILISTLLGLLAAWFSRSRWPLDWDPWRLPAFLGIVAVAVIFLLTGPIRRYFRWLATRYILTNRRLVVRSGWFGRRQRELSLAAVHSVNVRQGLLQRMLRSGDLLVASGFEGTARVPDVPEVMRFKTLLLDAISELPHSPLALDATVGSAPRTLGRGEAGYGDR